MKNLRARTPGGVRAFLALDFSTMAEARRELRRLGASRTGVKVGLELFTAAGPAAVKKFRADGWRVFLDLKLHDIPRTMERAAAAAAAIGADLLTVHASAGEAGVRAAVLGVRGSRTRILAVTVLTSEGGDVAGEAVLRARMAVGAGAHGLICSVEEARSIRREVGPGALIITPGIRFSEGEAHDQKRVATPEQAGGEGADAMVLGRAIFGDPRPSEALKRANRMFLIGVRAAGS
jgi:orotidine-5'-phosphate decarboxylase